MFGFIYYAGYINGNVRIQNYNNCRLCGIQCNTIISPVFYAYAYNPLNNS